MQGPFVRALGAVFHLNCFKCMVRKVLIFPDFFFPMPVIGLWGRRRFEILSHRWAWGQAKPTLRTRLFPKAESDLREVRNGFERQLYHGLQCVHLSFL